MSPQGNSPQTHSELLPRTLWNGTSTAPHLPSPTCPGGRHRASLAVSQRGTNGGAVTSPSRLRPHCKPRIPRACRPRRRRGCDPARSAKLSAKQLQRPSPAGWAGQRWLTGSTAETCGPLTPPRHCSEAAARTRPALVRTHSRARSPQLAP